MQETKNDRPVLGKGECILLVDDEKGLLNITKQTLETCGYAVLTAENGALAVGTFAQRQKDIAVVVMDMMMPVMSGPACIIALRQIDPNVKIIAASGLKEKENANIASLTRIDSFLAKPYSAKELLLAIRAQINKPALSLR
jgi:CheY-like chemotaxis protein